MAGPGLAAASWPPGQGTAAQQKIQNAAKQSALLSEAQKNTQSMLQGMLRSLGFQQVTVNFS